MNVWKEIEADKLYKGSRIHLKPMYSWESLLIETYDEIEADKLYKDPRIHLKPMYSWESLFIETYDEWTFPC